MEITLYLRDPAFVGDEVVVILFAVCKMSLDS